MRALNTAYQEKLKAKKIEGNGKNPEITKYVVYIEFQGKFSIVAANIPVGPRLNT